MFEINIPGRGSYRIDNLVFDVNGTIAVDGNLIGEVAARMADLSSMFDVYVITAGTHGRLTDIESRLGIKARKIDPSKEAEQKQDFVEKLGKESTISIGNGANDTLMLGDAAIGIAVIGQEGASVKAILAADIVVNNISDALNLLLKPKRLIATLRK